MSNNTGGGAFPRNVDGHYFMGMTLRDYFAAKAMQGWLATAGRPFGELHAMAAYEIADAMLKAREGK